MAGLNRLAWLREVYHHLKTYVRHTALMTQADRPDGEKNSWWVSDRGLRPVHEAVIVALLGFLIGILAAGVLYFIR